MDHRYQLKIKVKTLAFEGRAIRCEERRRRGEERAALHEHRTCVVRRAARNTLLAYGYIRGRKLAQLEQKRRTEPNWREVERMARQYGADRYQQPEFQAWRAG